MKKNSLFTTQKGFTLVETLVAITVLLLVVIGPMTVAQKGIQNAYFANEQITAVFLAQEAIEGVREFRDKVALEAYATGADTDAWIDLVNDGGANCDGGCAYVVEDGVGEFESCTVNNGCRLYIDDEGNYSYDSSGDESPFTREVTIVEDSSGTAQVTVDVTWTAKIFGGANNNRTYKLQTWIYDHYQRYEN